MKNTVRYIPVVTYTQKNYGRECSTKEEAMEELIKVMEKNKGPNNTFNIIEIEYENCTPEEWNKEING